MSTASKDAARAAASEARAAARAAAQDARRQVWAAEGAALRARREAAGLSQAELARRLGVRHRQMIDAVERGERGLPDRLKEEQVTAALSAPADDAS